MSGRIFVFGIDGAPYELMDKLSDEGMMPNFAKLKHKGIFKSMKVSIPEISSVSWTSIITGKNPAEHGILGFMDIIPDTYSLCFPNYSNMKEKPFWNQNEKKSVIVNVPTTYPAKPLNGFLVSGFVALDLERAVYPKEKFKDLEEMDYKIDADASNAHTSSYLFLKDTFATFDTRMKLFRKLWDEYSDWEYFMFVITGTDRLSHFFWDAYEDENHKEHNTFIQFYKKVDEAIGEIAEKLNDDDSLIIVSDHGFELTKHNVYINSILRENGFLDLKDEEKLSYNSITSKTKAFALDPARIYLNREGKYPNGCVKKEDEEKIIQELIEIFENLEKDGEKVIKKVFRKEEIYHGKCMEDAPDIILLGCDGYNLRGNIAMDKVYDQDIFKGKHKQDNAIFFLKTSKNIEIPENMTVFDIVPIIKKIESAN